MKVLITGGTGTIGRALAKLCASWNTTIFSNHEQSQVDMRRDFPQCKYIIGDIRDYDSVLRATDGMDYVFHLAALKHIDICERHPQEAIKTNVMGTMNVINACKINEVMMVNMSSDKAINPTSVYGMTKYLAEKMADDDGFVSIRSGNVLWSSGSVLEIWSKSIKEKNEIGITSKDMTRFFVHPTELADFILCNRNEYGVKTIPMVSFRLFDIAQEFIARYGNSDTKIDIMGLRAGERLHEFRDEETSSEDSICTDLKYIFG
jgi:FlaA1/EpsC-like NDP-sugar epimerase